MDSTKRTDEMSPEQVQQGNRSWWTRNTMSYDWHDPVARERFTQAWFDDVDARFIQAAALYATDTQPFDRLIPFEQIKGRRVLEIGCGMGLHTELMIRAGAQVTSVDLSPTSVQATTARLHLKGLAGNVMQADAEELPFPNESFDFVWSWGVIHHSARTAKIVREIARVLAPPGACRLMIYNRDGITAKIAFFKDHILKLGFLRRSFEETLYRSTDGFSARFFVPEHFQDLLRAFFSDVSLEVLGQEADDLPLPGLLRRLGLKFASRAWLQRKQAQRGSFLFARAATKI